MAKPCLILLHLHRSSSTVALHAPWRQMRRRNRFDRPSRLFEWLVSGPAPPGQPWGGACNDAATCAVDVFSTSDPNLQDWRKAEALRPGFKAYNTAVVQVLPSPPPPPARLRVPVSGSGPGLLSSPPSVPQPLPPSGMGILAHGGRGLPGLGAVTFVMAVEHPGGPVGWESVSVMGVTHEECQTDSQVGAGFLIPLALPRLLCTPRLGLQHARRSKRILRAWAYTTLVTSNG